MSECPDPANNLNCALAAAQDLVDRELVLVDYTSMCLGKAGLIVDRKASGALEVFNLRRVYAEGLTDIADLGCITCGRCVQIVDDDANVTVRLVD